MALIVSFTLPPVLRYVTAAAEHHCLSHIKSRRDQHSLFMSVDTPVANRPMDATASDPPRSTMLAMVPPWMIFKRFSHLSVTHYTSTKDVT